MPDGFSLHVRFAETGETFDYMSATGDPSGVRDAYAAVKGSTAGMDEPEIRQMLARELTSRAIDLTPDAIGVLAACVTASGATIAIGDPQEPRDLPQAGLVHSIVGKITGRIFAREVRELGREAITTSPIMSRLMPPVSPDSGRYAPGPGQRPAPAAVVVDPDTAQRMPWLLELPTEWPAGMPRSAMRDLSFEARLEEEDNAIAVYAFSDHIGELDATDAEAYLPHVRSARIQGKPVVVAANRRITRRGSLHITVRFRQLR
jgi:hypothetical protein